MGRLTVDDLTKHYDDGDNKVTAVDNLSLEIEDGEFLVLVGPSGCGKSTTLRCIAGLERPSSGEIYIGGEPIKNKKPKDRDIAMVFQNYALYPHMTARENMSFGLKMTTGLSQDEIRDRVEHASEMMGIDTLLDQKPGELSGGQQQRVALGRAIVREPEVFLMDEPLSNLDAKLRTSMRIELQNLQQELGITTIYVTHDQTEAMTMGDRVAILEGGQLQQVGTPLECYYHPRNEFVASFIGSPSMNFFDVSRADGVLRHPAFEYELTDDLRATLEGKPEDIVLGVRPEDIQFVGSAGHNTMTVTVDVVEPMGERTYVYFELGEKQLTATIGGDKFIQAGDEIHFSFPEERIHLFDRASGEAIKSSDVPGTEEQLAL